MNANDLGFSENEDFDFENSNLYLDSEQFIHDLEAAEGSENFDFENSDLYLDSEQFMDPYYENNPQSWDQRSHEISDELRECEIN